MYVLLKTVAKICLKRSTSLPLANCFPGNITAVIKVGFQIFRRLVLHPASNVSKICDALGILSQASRHPV